MPGKTGRANSKFIWRWGEWVVVQPTHKLIFRLCLCWHDPGHYTNSTLTGPITCNAGALQGKSLFPRSLRTTRNVRWPDRSPAY